jgi:hypothetical protein
MDILKHKKTLSFPNKSKIERVKNKKELRLRLIKLTNNYFKPRCEHYINGMRSFNLKIMEYSGGRGAIENAIKGNKHFHFGKKKDYLNYLTDLSQYNLEIIPFIKNLKDEFTNEEIDIIKKNKEYYLTNELLKENISMFNVPPLYQTINKEEADEKKGPKVFHNLNYFNKRRRNSIMNINILIQKKFPNEDNKDNIEPVNKKEYKLKNVIEDKETIRDNYKNMIEKEIRAEIRKKNKENKKTIDTKNLLTDIEKESKREISTFLKNKKEYDSKNRMSIFIEKGKKNKNLPSIRAHTFLKKFKNDLKDNNSNSIKRRNRYSKEKNYNLTKKIFDYEQNIIRDVNRRIKTIYENLNKKSTSIE